MSDGIFAFRTNEYRYESELKLFVYDQVKCRVILIKLFLPFIVLVKLDTAFYIQIDIEYVEYLIFVSDSCTNFDKDVTSKA